MSNDIPCDQCGKVHPRNALELCFKRPDVIAAMSSEQREKDVRESDDLCIIKSERFFVRGVLPLSVEGRERPHRIGVWVEIAQADFDRVHHLWEAPDQGKEPPFAATVANAIPSFDPTVGLAAKLQLTGPTSRPDVLIADQAHPLHREQQLGITEHRAGEYSSCF